MGIGHWALGNWYLVRGIFTLLPHPPHPPHLPHPPHPPHPLIPLPLPKPDWG